jgi:hypothetical protein
LEHPPVTFRRMASMCAQVASQERLSPQGLATMMLLIAALNRLADGEPCPRFIENEGINLDEVPLG